MWRYLTKIIETKSIPWKISRTFGLVHLAEINQTPAPYLMLQYIGRVATLTLVPRNCLRYLQTTCGEGNLSQKLWEVLSEKWMKNKKGIWKNLAFYFSLNSLFLLFGIFQMVLMTNWVTPRSLWPSKYTEVSTLWGDIMNCYHLMWIF